MIPIWDDFSLQLPRITQNDIKCIAGDAVGSTRHLTNMLSMWIAWKPKEATIDSLVAATNRQSELLTDEICNKPDMKVRYPGEYIT